MSTSPTSPAARIPDIHRRLAVEGRPHEIEIGSNPTGAVTVLDVRSGFLDPLPSDTGPTEGRVWSTLGYARRKELFGVIIQNVTAVHANRITPAFFDYMRPVAANSSASCSLEGRPTREPMTLGEEVVDVMEPRRYASPQAS